MSRSTKTWLIVAACLILVGCAVFGGIMTMLNWDFFQLSTVKYDTNEYSYHEPIRSISIETITAGIEFTHSDDGQTKVICYEQVEMEHTVAVIDGVLTIQGKDTRKWYERIGIQFGAPKITVCLPNAEYEALCVQSITGNIRLNGFSARSVSFGVTTGKITVTDLQCAGDVQLNVTTGKASLSGVVCQNLTSEGSTGDVALDHVIAADALRIQRSTGSIKLTSCDAANISIKTNTGDVIGSLRSGKTFDAQTDTGKIDVPKDSAGGQCRITTNTGNIKITIE